MRTRGLISSHTTQDWSGAGTHDAPRPRRRKTSHVEAYGRRCVGRYRAGGRSVCGWRWMAGWDGRLGVRLATERRHSARAVQVAKQIAFGLNPMDTTSLRGFEPSLRTLGYEDVFALPAPTKLFADGSTLSDIDVCARNPSLLLTFRENPCRIPCSLRAAPAPSQRLVPRPTYPIAVRVDHKEVGC